MERLTRLPVTAIIIAFNEADRIGRALRSLSWVDEIVVLDSGSTDETQPLARDAGAQVHVHPWEGYAKQKTIATGHATHRWILWIDADEEVTPELRTSIEQALALQAGTSPPVFSAYAMNRRTSYLGKLLRFGGWYPDRKVRLFDRERAGFGAELVHEELRVDGSVGGLRGDLNHYSYRDLNHHIEKTHEMARLWAAQNSGRSRVALWELLIHPAAKALKSYVVHAGFLEGWRGLLVAGVASYSVWLKYALLREAQAKRESG